MTEYLTTKVLSTLFGGFLLVTVAMTPLVMRFARRIDAVDRGGYRKVFQGAMPLLGGLGIALPLIVASLATGVAGYVIVGNWKWFWLNRRDSFDFLFSLAGWRSECIVVALGGIAIIALGMLDDTKGMRARWKLLGQVVVATSVCLSGFTLTSVSLPFMGAIELGMGFGSLITILWIVGLINAFNLIDGIDGLATGIALIGAAALTVLSIVQENTFAAFAGAALSGSLLAFLMFNFPPARIFLGDTGSMFLGYILAMLSLVGAQKSEAAVIIFAPMLALGFPVFETLISILRRYIRGVPIFTGDNFHTHHRLLRKGYSQPQVVLTLYGTGLLLATAAIMSALVPDESDWAWCPYALYCGTLVNIAWLAGYLRPTAFRIVLERRQRNRVFQALGQYAALRLNSLGRSVPADLLLELCRCELGLRTLEVRLKEGDRLLLSAGGKGIGPVPRPSERLLVKSSTGQDVLIGYDFEAAPDDSRRQDVCVCLASIFDQMIVGHAACVMERDLSCSARQ